MMEYAACGSLTSYVANRWQVAQHTGLFLSEDEARFFMRVSPRLQATLLLKRPALQLVPAGSRKGFWMAFISEDKACFVIRGILSLLAGHCPDSFMLQHFSDCLLACLLHFDCHQVLKLNTDPCCCLCSNSFLL